MQLFNSSKGAGFAARQQIFKGWDFVLPPSPSRRKQKLPTFTDLSSAGSIACSHLGQHVLKNSVPGNRDMRRSVEGRGMGRGTINQQNNQKTIKKQSKQNQSACSSHLTNSSINFSHNLSTAFEYCAIYHFWPHHSMLKSHLKNYQIRI